jgi:flagellar motor switch protein FliM
MDIFRIGPIPVSPITTRSESTRHFDNFKVKSITTGDILSLSTGDILSLSTGDILSLSTGDILSLSTN